MEIRCPRCGGRAAFDEPFQFVSARKAHGLPDTGTRWGGWYVREKYPSLIRWKAPRESHQYLSTGTERSSGAYRPWNRGVVRCRECHLVAVHVLRWPGDAYFQWNVRGTRLWACGIRRTGVRCRSCPPASWPRAAAPPVARRIRGTLQAIGESAELAA